MELQKSKYDMASELRNLATEIIKSANEMEKQAVQEELEQLKNYLSPFGGLINFFQTEFEWGLVENYKLRMYPISEAANKFINSLSFWFDYIRKILEMDGFFSSSPPPPETKYWYICTKHHNFEKILSVLPKLKFKNQADCLFLLERSFAVIKEEFELFKEFQKKQEDLLKKRLQPLIDKKKQFEAAANLMNNDKLLDQSLLLDQWLLIIR